MGKVAFAQRRRWQSVCFFVAVAAVLLVQPRRSQADSPVMATTSRAAREDAIRSIPFQQLTAEMQSQLTDVVSRPTIYRRLPLEVTPCDPDLYVFLVRYPEVIVNIWQIMGITKCSTRRTGPYSIAATDGVGTTCNIQLVYGTKDTHILYGEGYHESSLVKKNITGRAVIILKSGYTRDTNGRPLVTSRLDMFVQLDHSGIDLLAKTLQPLVGRSADHNFEQTARFVGQVSDAAERNGPGVQRLASKLSNLEPAVRNRLVELAAVVSHRASVRQSTSLQSADGTTTVVRSSTPPQRHRSVR